MFFPGLWGWCGRSELPSESWTRHSFTRNARKYSGIATHLLGVNRLICSVLSPLNPRSGRIIAAVKNVPKESVPRLSIASLISERICNGRVGKLFQWLIHGGGGGGFWGARPHKTKPANFLKCSDTCNDIEISYRRKPEASLTTFIS